MPKRTLFVLLILVLLAVLGGVVRYIFIPQYNAMIASQQYVEVLPSPIIATSSAKIAQPKISAEAAELISLLSTEDRIAQVFVVAASAPSTQSARSRLARPLPTVLKQLRLGAISVTSSDTDVLSPPLFASGSSTATPSALPTAVLLTNQASQSAQMCTITGQCTLISPPLELGTELKGASLSAELVLETLQESKLVVISAQTSASQLQALFDRLANAYDQSPTFQSLVDHMLGIVLTAKLNLPQP